MEGGDARPVRQPFRSLRIAAALLGVLLAAAGAGTIAFRGAGRWLVREDPLSHADVILVLSGGLPYRAEKAAQLYHQGYAPEVWITRPAGPAAELRSMGVNYVGEEEYNRRILLLLEVPDGAIHIIPGEILDTEEEIDLAREELRREGKSTVLIVTSPPHTRRVHTLWRVLVGKRPQAIVRAAYEDRFDAGHWWRNTRDTLAVVREYLGLMNAWAGLPVEPPEKERR
jgi:uncharacterized SAM-binding protein YcdF (DUF218 family)